MKRMFVGLAVAAALVMVGCGGKDDGSSNSSGTSGSGASSGSSGTSGSGSTSGSTGSSSSSSSTGGGPWSLYNHSPFPTVPNVSGGPTLDKVQLITITFDGYAYRDTVEGFGDWLVGSDWLNTVGEDYGVGQGEHYAKVHLSDPAPGSITDSQVQFALAAYIDTGVLPMPAGVAADTDGGSPEADGGSPDTDGGSATADPLTEPLYAIYFPSSSTITFDGNQGTSCQDFGGYHSFFNYHGVNVSYAVLPTCEIGSYTVPSLEVAASHETIEAATDPFPQSSFNDPNTTSYSLEDYNSPWSFIPGEVGDLCVGTQYQDVSGYWVQRSWSNSAALAGTGSPCVPAPSYVYFNVSTDYTNVIPASPGETVTNNVTAWTDREYTQPWHVKVQLYQSSFYPQYTFSTADGHSLTEQSGFNAYVQMRDRDTATLSVTVPANASRGRDFTSLIITSETGNGEYTMWPVAIYVQ